MDIVIRRMELFDVLYINGTPFHLWSRICGFKELEDIIAEEGKLSLVPFLCQPPQSHIVGAMIGIV